MVARPRRLQASSLRCAISPSVGIWGAVALGLVLLWFTWDMPSPARAVTRRAAPGDLLLDPSGHLAARFGDASAASFCRATLPPYVPAAFIAIEDRRFYEHGPFDCRGIARGGVRHCAPPCRAGRLDPHPAGRQNTSSFG